MAGVRNPWEIYDRLIEGVPADVRVVDACVGRHWTCVSAESGAGVAYTFHGGVAPAAERDVAGARLRDVAALVKSWCFEDASLGAAALNAFYAVRGKLEGPGLATGEASDGFSLVMGRIEQHPDVRPKVCVIGHFPHMDELAAVSDLTVLERRPREGDLPDAACEYVLPDQDFVLMTGTTFTNKTMPRLLELAQGATVVVTGPTTPMLPVLFDYGVDALAGRIVGDASAALTACATGAPFGNAFLKCALVRPGV